MPPPPAKLVDLTSDFFVHDKKEYKVVPAKEGSGEEPQLLEVKKGLYYRGPPREKRLIINNPRQNSVMVDLGKCRIRQLKDYQGRLTAGGTL
jgi:hypothetical protein